MCIRDSGLTGKDSSILKAETYSFVNPSFLGMGYGTKALALQAFFAFYLWNLQKIWCYTDSDNKSSQHMHYKIGYIKEGELRNEAVSYTHLEIKGIRFLSPRLAQLTNPM